MSDRCRRMADEEIERLVRDAPRRMPSPQLWERVSARAGRAAPRPRWRWRVAATMGAAAIVALAAGMLLLTPGGPTPPHRSVRPGGVRVRVAAAPPAAVAQSPTRVASAAPVVTMAAEQPRTARRKITIRRVAPRPNEVLPVRGDVTPPEISPASAAEQMAAAISPAPPAAEVAESSYYIEVSRGGATSVLEGSVAESSSGDSKEIRIAYDTTTPGTDGAN